ncbi:MAG: isoprenylcysteine carboxylmethyltransferase family protein [Acidobacteriaceae bacterium]|nr:isoprenylcysteine carboxylmethyltransferase family protein [Acidobacteriaceae bacterium]MBV9780747.1 isoprenylcysteine carboxylmethyltransferase family protein [Acidobacteriaceae bacterium]
MPAYGYVIIAIGFVAWITPFFLMKRPGTRAEKVDRRARWGMVLEGIGYAVLWQSDFWARPPGPWRIGLSILFFAAASLFSWSSARTLGRQWRFDAGLNPDHQLVRSGVYGVVRHPIYASMLCLFLGMGFMVAPWVLFLIGAAIFLAGTEIRVRVEEKLLAAHFGAEFTEYRRSVPAYIPLLKGF